MAAAGGQGNGSNHLGGTSAGANNTHWLARVWPILSQASGVTVILMLVMLALVYVELKRVHRNNETLVHSLLATKDEHLVWLKRFANCQPTEQAK